jgi:hypothetical protein
MNPAGLLHGGSTLPSEQKRRGGDSRCALVAHGGHFNKMRFHYMTIIIYNYEVATERAVTNVVANCEDISRGEAETATDAEPRRNLCTVECQRSSQFFC